jgi:aminocarboxymuconate-semialdehyde decarboxylase
MMFDAHAHWLPEEIIAQAHFYSRAWGGIDSHLEAMDKHSVARTLIVYPTNDAHTRMGGLSQVARLYNERLAELVARYPERLVGAAILPVNDPAEMVREFERATKDLGLKALSLGSSFEGVYLDDEGFFGLYEAAQAGGIPIFVHPQTVNPIGYERLKHPLLTPVIEFVFDTTVCIGKLITSGTLKRFPNLKFVFAHFGGVMPFIKERFDGVYHMLRSRDIVPDLGAPPASYLKQIYVDTSGVTSGFALKCTISMVGADHVLWGSDYPGNPDIAASVSAVAELNISPQEKAAILGGNAGRLLS